MSRRQSAPRVDGPYYVIPGTIGSCMRCRVNPPVFRVVDSRKPFFADRADYCAECARAEANERNAWIADRRRRADDRRRSEMIASACAVAAWERRCRR